MIQNNELNQVILKLIDSATLRAKNRRIKIALPMGIMIKLSPFDLSYNSALLSMANYSRDFDNIPLTYIDDYNLELKTVKITFGTLKSIISLLANLSLRIDLKAEYRLHQLRECKTEDDKIKLLNSINTEEEAIETEYLEH